VGILSDDVMRADDAERALLGALLWKPAAVADLPGMEPDAFYVPLHQRLFATVVEVAGKPDADATLIGTLLPSLRSEIFELAQVAPAVSTVAYYGEQVANAAMRRKIDLELRKAQQAIRQDDIDDALLNVASSLVAVDVEMDAPTQAGRVPSGFYELGDFVHRHDRREEWVIPGLICRQERIMVIASEGSGKSMMARQMAVMAAIGMHPLTRDRIRPVKTLQVDLENPSGIIAKKTRPMVAYAEELNLWTEGQAFIWHRPAGINLRKMADRREFDQVLAACQPELVCFGPLYKAAAADHANPEQQAQETAQALDDMREKYGAAFWIEHHAPLGQNGQRELRPFGSALWMRWPEFGLVLRKNEDPKIGARILHVDANGFRQQRDERTWPIAFRYDQRWPWRPIWEEAELEEAIAEESAGAAPEHKKYGVGYGWDSRQVQNED
jgi:hypothetical protein